MSERNTVLRSMHDTGLAGWSGGSLMGAAGLNGAASAAQRQQRVAQRMIPVFTGALLVVSSLAGEQQKPGSVRRGVGARVRQFLTPSA